MDDWKSVFSCDECQTLDAHFRCKTLDREVAAMDLDYGSSFRRDRAAVIIVVGAIRRTHLDESSTTARHYVGNTETAADLDKLTSRDQNFFPLRNRIERKDHRGRAVVDYQRILCAGEFAQEPDAVRVSRPALTPFDIVFEIAESFGDMLDRSYRRVGERSASEIGVKHNACRVDYAPQ